MPGKRVHAFAKMADLTAPLLRRQSQKPVFPYVATVANQVFAEKSAEASSCGLRMHQFVSAHLLGMPGKRVLAFARTVTSQRLMRRQSPKPLFPM